jgi:hypothetical protein
VGERKSRLAEKKVVQSQNNGFPILNKKIIPEIAGVNEVINHHGS